MPSEFPASPAIGIFDSGIGGLSVLRHIRAYLPHEHLLYFADSGFAPYGDKPEDVIAARSLGIAGFFMQQQVKALVVACNTATAAAIKSIRTAYPALPVVGVEPGLKPAASLSKTRVVGVLATEGTLASARFDLLRGQIAAASGVLFLMQPCVGLADQIEKGELHSAATAVLVRRYVEPLLEQGADTLVLGCTHYPFVQALIEEVVQRITTRPIAIVDTGDAVARQLVRLMDERGLRRAAGGEGSLAAFSTGSESALSRAFSRLLKLHPAVTRVTEA
ncbi:MAG: glutamate racemase [Burkholderiales bacterium]|jgi:glutamate racemase